jgi:hypothetical protein
VSSKTAVEVDVPLSFPSLYPSRDFVYISAPVERVVHSCRAIDCIYGSEDAICCLQWMSRSSYQAAASLLY